MKFSLVILLGFCAIMAQGFESVPADGSNIVEFNALTDIIQKITQAVNNAINKVVEKAKEVGDKITGALGEAMDKAMEKVKNIAKVIADLAKAGAVAKKCSEPYQEKMQEIMNAMQAEVDVCRKNGLEQAQEVQQEMQEAVNEMIKLAQDAYASIANCLKGEGAFGCVVGQIFPIRDKVKAGYEKAITIIDAAQERLPEIVENTQTCIQSAQEKPTEQLNDIVRLIQKCIAENRFYYL